MPYLHVADFRFGMDRRRPQHTGVPGTLWTLANAFMSRGGDIVRAKKFVSTYTLPSGTFGLASLKGQLYVFGSAAAPTMPALVQYQRLQAGGVRATGTVTITGGTASAGVNKVSALTVNGVSLISAAVDWVTSNDATATALAAAINSGPQAANYSAAAVGAVVTITALTHGTGSNGYVVDATGAGNVTTTDVNMASGTTATMTRVLDAKGFAGKLYVTAEFNDGGVYHFYDGVRLSDWDTVGASYSSLAQVAEVLARKINAVDAVEAYAVGEAVVIVAEVAGTAFTCSASATDPSTDSTPTATATQLVANVAEVAETRATGTVTVTGGAAVPGVDRITSITVDGVELLAEPVDWIGSNAATATAIAVAINNTSADTDLTAEASGATVTIRAAVGTGTGPNGDVVAATTGGGMTVGTANMAGGVAAVAAVAQVYRVVIGAASFDDEDSWSITVNGTAYLTTGLGAGVGTSAYVFKKRVYSTAASLLHYSALDDAEDWTTASPTSTGAGFINMSSDSEGSQQIVGAATYQGNTAVFGRETIRIYALSADADENTIVDTLEQTGTYAPGSILAYGNLDVFYLDDSGIRSIRTRDGYNAAYVSDVGSAIDSFVQEYVADAGHAVAGRAVAAVDVIDGRYWLAIGERIFALSYYPGSKITAWSYLEPGFSVEQLVRVGKRIFARSGDTVYLYGGADGATYPDDDEQLVVAETVFVSANDPAGKKQINAFDMAGENDWLVELLVDPDDTTKVITIATVNKVTYNLEAINVPGHAALVALRFTCSRSGYASLSNFALHYDKSEKG